MKYYYHLIEQAFTTPDDVEGFRYEEKIPLRTRHDRKQALHTYENRRMGLHNKVWHDEEIHHYSICLLLVDSETGEDWQILPIDDETEFNDTILHEIQIHKELGIFE